MRMTFNTNFVFNKFLFAQSTKTMLLVKYMAIVYNCVGARGKKPPGIFRSVWFDTYQGASRMDKRTLDWNL
jgi:hypothetical protein